MKPAMSDVERLIAINEIREVMAHYARRADQKDFDALARLFTPDGAFTTHQLDGTVWIHTQGRKAIAKTLTQSVGIRGHSRDLPPFEMRFTFAVTSALMGPERARNPQGGRS